MAARTYKIKITRDGQEFEAEGDKAFVLKMLAQFEISTSLQLHDAPKNKSGKGRKRYTLTGSGEKYIETKLSGGA